MNNLNKCNSSKTDEKDKEEDKLNHQRAILSCVLNIVSKLGDMVNALNGAKLSQKLGIGNGFSDRVAGLGGLVAGAIQLYQIFSK